MLNQLNEYKNIEEFKNIQIKKLFIGFKKDYISNKESFYLLEKLKEDEFENIEKIIYSKMSR